MAKKQKKDGWLKRSITWLDNKMFSSNTPEFEPMLHSVMALGIYAGIGLGIVVAACQAFSVNETLLQVIAGVVLIGVVAYAIMKVLPNIKAFESIVKKILYVVVILSALSVTMLLGVYLLILAILLLVVYVIFWFWSGGSSSSKGSDSSGREYVATLEDGVKIYRGTDLLGNDYYRGSDGYDYTRSGNGEHFYRK